MDVANLIPSTLRDSVDSEACAWPIVWERLLNLGASGCQGVQLTSETWAAFRITPCNRPCGRAQSHAIPATQLLSASQSRRPDTCRDGAGILCSSKDSAPHGPLIAGTWLSRCQGTGMIPGGGTDPKSMQRTAGAMALRSYLYLEKRLHIC